VGYSGFPDLQRLQAEENGPFYDACLLERVVPLAAGLAERLDAGIDVLDISRGQGHAVNLLAGAFWGRGEGRRRGRPQPLSRRLSGVRFAPADQRGGARRTIWAGCWPPPTRISRTGEAGEARMTAYDLAIIAGDGVGPEVTAQALKAIRAAADRFGFAVATTDYDLGGRRYLATGEVLPDTVLSELRGHDAILLGAVGTPGVPPGVLERGLLLRIRFAFDQYVNLRPVKLLPGVPSPVAGLTPERCDLVVVRENTEGLYSGAGGTLYRGTPSEVATQESLNTRRGVERVVRDAFARAAARRGRLTLCHKTNVLLFAGDLWQRTVDEVASEFPDVTVDYAHVDALCLYLVTAPERFDVVVTDNLFGDIVTDLGAAVQGGLGLAASGNIDPSRAAPSMFEPVHGSAPDIAGRGWANPVAAVLSAAMCLAHLGEQEAGSAVETAAAGVLPTMRAMAGEAMGASTDELGDRIAEMVAAGA
jgi:3-isopropylmalate dehydrogenase